MSREEQLKYSGYDAITSFFVPNSDFDDVIARIQKMDRINKVYDVARMAKEEALIDTRIFYDEKFKVHNVLLYDKHRFLWKKFALIRPSNPFKIPVEYIPCDDIFEGTVVEHFIEGENPFVTFKSIMLSGNVTEHTPISYAHELMHTQIDSIKGCVTDYYDAEVLSIFIELVFTYYISKDGRLLNLEDSRRIAELDLLNTIARMYDRTGTLEDDYRISSATLGKKDAEIREEMIENTKYLVSDLKAYNLFITFYYGSNSIKKEMLRLIQKIIDGEISLTDYLKKYDVDLNSSQDNKRLLKYFGRKNG